MKQNNRISVTEEISLQSNLRPALPQVGANKDYHEFRIQLGNIDKLLKRGNLESMAMDFALEGFEEAKARVKRARLTQALKNLRIEVLRLLLGNLSNRAFSKLLASSAIMADFCGLQQIDRIKGTSKSTVDRASRFFREDQLRWMVQVLLEMVCEEDRSRELGLSEPFDASVCLVDATCLECNIHFPVDWVLLRDVSKTLLKAIKLIRKEGLCCRMPVEPERFAKQMSKLCIEMTHSRRKKNAIKSRKSVLRKMKPLLRTIAEHARRHRDRLQSDWGLTRYSRKQAEQIIARIDQMLAQVPEVIRQAHERIIAGRQIPSQDKLLSVYEADVQVIVRGKAGREVEFGNTLFLGENMQGLILDWALYQQSAPSEPKQLDKSLGRQNTFDLSAKIGAVCADRGFSSKACSLNLRQSGIFDAVCPKKPEELKERMNEEQFRTLQTRRASTEARIAIIKQKASKRLRQKGFKNRERAMAGIVLAHNLWLVARKLLSQQAVPKAA